MDGYRCSASLAILNGYIYVVGGKNQSNNDATEVELYDPLKDDWLQVASMNGKGGASTLFKYNMSLYAIGGVVRYLSDGTKYYSTEQYDLLKNMWTEVCNIYYDRKSKLS